MDINSSNESLFEQFGGKESARGRNYLREGEAQIYIHNGKGILSINAIDSAEIQSKRYTRMDIQRNKFTKELFLVFNNEVGWQWSEVTKQHPSIRMAQRGMIFGICGELGVPTSGKFVLSLTPTITKGVYKLFYSQKD